MQKRNNKKMKGSAILWAVCTLLIFMIIVSAVIVLSQFYMNRELTSFSDKQAEYYAKSGAEIIASEIINEKGINSMGDIVDNGAFPVVLNVTLTNGTICKVTVEKQGENILTVLSEAECADSKAMVACKINAELDIERTRQNKLGDGSYFWKYNWIFDGYYTY